MGRRAADEHRVGGAVPDRAPGGRAGGDRLAILTERNSCPSRFHRVILAVEGLEAMGRVGLWIVALLGAFFAGRRMGEPEGSPQEAAGAARPRQRAAWMEGLRI